VRCFRTSRSPRSWTTARSLAPRGWLNLHEAKIPFILRLRENQYGVREGDVTRTIAAIARHLNKGQKMILKGACRLGQNEPASLPPIRLVIMRIASGELLALACSSKPHDALASSRRRWTIETMFGNLKTKGFNLEDTHLTNADKLPTGVAAAWRLSNTMDARFCIEALNEALAQYGKPEIFNTDQGSQFTGLDFTGVLKDANVAISMDGRGRCMDNIFIERLWRSLKYVAVYLHEMTDGFAAERVIGEWIAFYNTERPHSALDGATPAEAYATKRPVDMMDKARALPTSPQAQPQRKTFNMNGIMAA